MVNLCDLAEIMGIQWRSKSSSLFMEILASGNLGNLSESMILFQKTPWNPLKLPPPPGLPPPACHSPGGLTQWSPQTLMIRNVGKCCPNQRLTSQLFNTCFWWFWWIPSGCFWCELIPLRKCCFANRINFKQKIENYSWPKFIRPNLYTHRSS